MLRRARRISTGLAIYSSLTRYRYARVPGRIIVYQGRVLLAQIWDIDPRPTRIAMAPGVHCLRFEVNMGRRPVQEIECVVKVAEGSLTRVQFVPRRGLWLTKRSMPATTVIGPRAKLCR